MSDGWLPVPRSALSAFDASEWHAVVDLYKRASALDWRPFRFTERALCDAWRVGNRRVWAILDALAELGLLQVERGDKRRDSLCTVKRPAQAPDANAVGGSVSDAWLFAPIPRDHWPHVLKLVQADNGGELPAWAMSADLVYLASLASQPKRRLPFPGRRELQRRWSTSDRKARLALADEEWQAVCKRHGIPLPERKAAFGTVSERKPRRDPDAVTLDLVGAEDFDHTLGVPFRCSGCSRPGASARGGLCPRCADDEGRQ